MPDVSQVTDISSALSGIIGAVLLFVAGLAWLKAKAWFAEVITDVKATKVQTTNSHDTNMRDDITEALTKIDTLTTSVGDVVNGMERLNARQTEVHEDLRETRKDLRFATGYVRDVDKRLIEHVDKTRGGSDVPE
jgi:flagellin-like hook-associated protein FlgL